MNNIYSTLHHCTLHQCTLNQCTLKQCKKNTLPLAVPAVPLSHALVPASPVPAALAVPVPLSHALVPASHKKPPSVNRNIKPEIITFIDGIVEESY
jgi:hypothetical protein